VKAIAEAVRKTLDDHSLWMPERDIERIARQALLHAAGEKRDNFVAHAIETTAKRSTPIERICPVCLAGYPRAEHDAHMAAHGYSRLQIDQEQTA
jgi:hypothetical protein